jgi:cell division protein FtsA
MAKVFQDKVVVSIDVGTTKICVLVAQYDERNLQILGIGKAPSDGLRKGVVVDMQKTVASIKAALKEAEQMANVVIHSVAVGVSGGHISATNSQGMVPIKSGFVQQQDITNVLNAARAFAIPEEMQILHVLPQFFIIDSRDKVQNPFGMHGIRLQVQAHVIMGAIASVQNLVRCCELAGVKVTDIILEQLASAQAVLSPDERELGIAMLDIGGGTSDLALYQQGNIRHTFVLPVAGNHFTNDLAVCLRTTFKDAERIKKEYGLAYDALLEHDNLIEIDAVQGNEKQYIKRSDIVAILQPRAHELLSLIHNEIMNNGLATFMPAGFVLTGGGALLPGMKELAETIFKVPVRIGALPINNPTWQSLQSPVYATGYGLLKHITLDKNSLSVEGPLTMRIFMRMKSWIIDFF